MKAIRKSDGKIIEVREWRGASDVVYSTLDMNEFYQAEDLDFLPEKETAVLEGWICRDFDDWLWLFTDEETPKRESFRWDGDNCMELPKWLFPSVTWESEPKKVRIKLTALDE